MEPHILTIDDEPRIRDLIGKLLYFDGYKQIEQAESIAKARSKIAQRVPDVVICDVNLPDGNGVDFVREFKEKYPASEIMLLTTYGNISDGIQAMKNGAFDYLVKGDDNGKITLLAEKAWQKVQLQNRVQKLEAQISEKFAFDNVIGKSEIMMKTINLAKKVANSDATILLLGETGTGKEVFARAIHSSSPRKSESFVAINCGALSAEILESELFGHKAGAFTGAVKDKKGLFQEAHNGTIFLDELGEMPLELQAKLLRVLENGTFMRVGDTKEVTVDVRVVAATNRDLQQEVKNGNFREDLLYRISVFAIKLPSLLERTEDIPLLMEHFVNYFCAKSNRKPLKISKAFEKAILSFPLKGNVRELRNLIERATILVEGDQLTPDLLPTMPASVNSNPEEHSLTLASAEKKQIQRVIEVAKGNKTQAAKLLDIGLTTLYQKIKDYDLKG